VFKNFAKVISEMPQFTFVEINSREMRHVRYFVLG
jgi:hypothetical protein